MTVDPDRLDALLEAEPYLDDAGFTARVMDRLPPRRRDQRPLVLGLSAVAAGVSAALVLPEAVRAGLTALAGLALPVAVPPGLLVGLAAALVVAAVAGLVVAVAVEA